VSLNINIAKAMRHGLELAAIEIVKGADKFTPVDTSSLRNSIRYEVRGNTRVDIISGGGTNDTTGTPLKDYAEKQYYGNTGGKSGGGKKLRHLGDFESGLASIIARYAGSLTVSDTHADRYSAAWKLADDAGALKWLGQPRWIERSFWYNKAKVQKRFASAFKPGAYK
jgi:hypothetical protein